MWQLVSLLLLVVKIGISLPLAMVACSNTKIINYMMRVIIELLPNTIVPFPFTTSPAAKPCCSFLTLPS